MKGTGPITSLIWNLMPPKTIYLLLNHLAEQARQSNSKVGSQAEPLIFHSIDFGGGLNVAKVGRVHCRTKKLLDVKGLSFNQHESGL